MIVEGEGSFFITKGDNFRLGFSIGQSIKDLISSKVFKWGCVLVKYNHVILLEISQHPGGSARGVTDFIISKFI